MKKTILMLVVIAAPMLLIFPNLGVRTLWQDEAETALVARQMVKTNTWLPYAWDEQGPISQDWNYQFSVSPLWRWHPWLQFYVTALSFKLFGVSALTARLPFAITGVIFFWYYLGFLKRRGPKNLVFFLIANLLVLTSAPLLLHLRQARYYALSVLFTLMTVDGYLSIKNGKRSFRYIIGSIALFHSFLPGALALQIAFWIDALRHPGGVPHLMRDDDRISARRFYRFDPSNGSSLQNDNGRNFLLRFARAFALTLLFTLPWAWWLKIRGQNLNFDPELIKQHLRQHYLYIHKFIVPFFLVGTLAFPRVRKALISDRNAFLFLTIVAVNMILFTFNHPYFFRYLVPLIPLFAYLTALIITSLSLPAALIAATFVIPMSWSTFPGYIYEITNPYVGTNEQLVAWLSNLNQSGSPSLAVNYDDFTFRFHTPLVVYGAQHLPTLTTCPGIIIIFPEWGNEERLREIAMNCSLSRQKRTYSFSKLTDDPSPVTHRFSPPTTGSIEIYYTREP